MPRLWAASARAPPDSLTIWWIRAMSSLASGGPYAIRAGSSTSFRPGRRFGVKVIECPPARARLCGSGQSSRVLTVRVMTFGKVTKVQVKALTGLVNIFPAP